MLGEGAFAFEQALLQVSDLLSQVLGLLTELILTPLRLSVLRFKLPMKIGDLLALLLFARFVGKLRFRNTLLFLGPPCCPLLGEGALAFEQLLLHGHDLSLQLLSLHRGGRLQGLNLLCGVLTELIFTLLRLSALRFKLLLEIDNHLALLLFA